MTDKEKALILQDIVMVTDSREKNNHHILDCFELNCIPYTRETMETADYSFFLPNYPELGFDYSVLIERKNSLDEIATNFTKHRERFVREFERLEDEEMHLVIEGATWKKLLKGSYRSQFHPKSFMASLLTFNVRYQCNVWFATIEESPTLIYNLMYYSLFEKLKNLDN